MVVTGVPGAGKSEFVDELAIQLNTLHKWRWGYFSPENYPVYLHASKLIAKLSGKWIKNMSRLDLDEYALYVNNNIFWITPKDEEYTLDIILSKARFLVRKYGIKGLVIDPWNTIEFHSQGLTETLYISKALGQLAHFARQNDILLVLVAHPRKLEKIRGGEYEIPNLYSISGSAHFFNKADYGLTVYRTCKDEVSIFVQKVKFRTLGKKGKVHMLNNQKSGRYQECKEVKLDGKEVWEIDKWENKSYIIFNKEEDGKD